MSADDFAPQPMNGADARHIAARQQDAANRAFSLQGTDSNNLVELT